MARNQRDPKRDDNNRGGKGNGKKPGGNQGVSQSWTLAELGQAPPGMQWVLTPGGGAALQPLPQQQQDNDPQDGNDQIPPKPNVPGMDFYWSGQEWVGVPIEGYESPSDKAKREAEERDKRQTAEQYLTDLLTSFGLAELVPTVSSLIKEWGTNSTIIASRLRATETYKERFRGNEYRIKNGYSAMTEAEYLSTEDAIKTTMRKYGLTNDYYSRDKLANLIGGDVSATEVDGRIGQAKKVIDNADPNIKNSLVGLYGVGMGDMLGYVLAPETALEVVQRRVNAGFAAGVARGQGIDLGTMGDTSLAEQIGDLTYGDERTLRAQFDNIGGLARSTRRLSGIDQEQVSDRDVVKGEFGIDAQAGQKVKRMQSRERARFSGQSATTSSTLSGGGF